jgi:hypothetical protein
LGEEERLVRAIATAVVAVVSGFEMRGREEVVAVLCGGQGGPNTCVACCWKFVWLSQ